METEMERLRRNAEEEKGKQVHKELVEYVSLLDVEIEDRRRWHYRARNLELIVLFVHFGSMIYLGIQGALYSEYGWIGDISFTLWLLTALRSSVIHTQAISAIREQIGIINTLRILGMIKDDTNMGNKRKRKVKKWSLFERYQEFWERVTEGKTQEKFA